MGGFGEAISFKVYHPGLEKFITEQEFKAYQKKQDENYSVNLEEEFKEWQANREKASAEKEKKEDPAYKATQEADLKTKRAEHMRKIQAKGVEARQAKAKEK